MNLWGQKLQGFAASQTKGSLGESNCYYEVNRRTTLSCKFFQLERSTQASGHRIAWKPLCGRTPKVNLTVECSQVCSGQRPPTGCGTEKEGGRFSNKVGCSVGLALQQFMGGMPRPASLVKTTEDAVDRSERHWTVCLIKQRLEEKKCPALHFFPYFFFTRKFLTVS